MHKITAFGRRVLSIGTSFLAGSVVAFFGANFLMDALYTGEGREHPKEARVFANGYEKAYLDLSVNPTNQTYDNPLTIYYGDKQVPFEQGGSFKGQQIIDTTNNASTWGNHGVFLGNDNQNTLFIGHLNKQFTNLDKVRTIVVTDSQGTAFHYTVTAIYLVNEKGYGVEDGEYYGDNYLRGGTQERITLQTYYAKGTYQIVEAIAAQ